MPDHYFDEQKTENAAGQGLGSRVQKALKSLSDRYPAPDKTTRMKKGSKQKRPKR